MIKRIILTIKGVIMKVQLEDGVWLSYVFGDPGRTVVEQNAMDFKIVDDAMAALVQARTYHPFDQARVCAWFHNITDTIKGVIND